MADPEYSPPSMRHLTSLRRLRDSTRSRVPGFGGQNKGVELLVLLGFSMISWSAAETSYLPSDRITCVEYTLSVPQITELSVLSNSVFCSYDWSNSVPKQSSYNRNLIC